MSTLRPLRSLWRQQNAWCREFSCPRRLLSTSSSLPNDSSWIAALSENLSHIEQSTNPYELRRHGRGESYHPVQSPNVICMPTSTEQVQEIVRFCWQHRVPLIPFGAGTSVEGHVTALYGGVSLDLCHFQSIQVPDMSSSGDDDDEETLPDPIATVGAGVTRSALNQALRHTGMQFVVDPGADATLGGMVATGASGTTTVRYGSTRENLLALECVLASDETAPVVHVGTKSLKNSAGYDLLSLLCGSEGTLGVITSVTVKLHPIPDHVVGAVCVFESLAKAALAVAALKLSEIPLSRCELLDDISMEAFNAYTQAAAPDQQHPAREVKPTLFLEFQGSSDASLQEQVAMTEAILNDYGGSSFEFATSDEERKALWSARHSLYPATLALRPGSTGAIVTDACVPLSQFSALIEATAADVKKYDVVGPCFGHAGDGNLHCILPVKDDDPKEYLDRLELVNAKLIDRTLKMGGTCTGEHGIGYGKIKYLERQYGKGAVDMMKAVKKSLDPCNIMNPGKVVSISSPP